MQSVHLGSDFGSSDHISHTIYVFFNIVEGVVHSLDLYNGLRAKTCLYAFLFKLRRYRFTLSWAYNKFVLELQNMFVRILC